MMFFKVIYRVVTILVPAELIEYSMPDCFTVLLLSSDSKHLLHKGLSVAFTKWYKSIWSCEPTTYAAFTAA